MPHAAATDRRWHYGRGMAGVDALPRGARPMHAMPPPSATELADEVPVIIVQLKARRMKYRLPLARRVVDARPLASR